MVIINDVINLKLFLDLTIGLDLVANTVVSTVFLNTAISSPNTKFAVACNKEREGVFALMTRHMREKIRSTMEMIMSSSLFGPTLRWFFTRFLQAGLLMTHKLFFNFIKQVPYHITLLLSWTGTEDLPRPIKWNLLQDTTREV